MKTKILEEFKPVALEKKQFKIQKLDNNCFFAFSAFQESNAVKKLRDCLIQESSNSLTASIRTFMENSERFFWRRICCNNEISL